MKKNQKDHLSKFDKRISKGYPSDREMPVIIILKRKAIRVYPDNQKVALYYSQALDRYISVPFGSKGEPLGMVMKEESQLDEVKFFNSPNTVNPNPNVRMRSVFGKPINKNMRTVKLQPKKSNQKSQDDASDEKKRVEPGLETPEARAALAAQIVPNPVAFAIGQMVGQVGSTAVKLGAHGIKTLAKKVMKESDSTMSDNHLKESFASNLRVLREQGYKTKEEVPVMDPADIKIPGTNMKITPLDVITGVGGVAKGLAAKGASKLASTVLKKKASQKIADKYMKERGKSVIGRKWAAKRKAEGGKLRKFGRGVAKVATGAVGAAAAVAASMDGDRSSFAKRLKPDKDFGLQPKVYDPTPSQEPISSVANAQRAWYNTTPPQQQNPLQRGQISQSGMSRINEQLQTLVKSKNAKPIQLKLLDENTVTINKGTAKKLLKTYNGLNEQNKKYMEKMLQESIVTFKQALTFATKNRT